MQDMPNIIVDIEALLDKGLTTYLTLDMPEDTLVNVIHLWTEARASMWVPESGISLADYRDAYNKLDKDTLFTIGDMTNLHEVLGDMYAAIKLEDSQRSAMVTYLNTYPYDLTKGEVDDLIGLLNSYGSYKVIPINRAPSKLTPLVINNELKAFGWFTLRENEWVEYHLPKAVDDNGVMCMDTAIYCPKLLPLVDNIAHCKTSEELKAYFTPKEGDWAKLRAELVSPLIMLSYLPPIQFQSTSVTRIYTEAKRSAMDL